MFYFHPHTWRNDSHFDKHIFSNGLKPPTTSSLPRYPPWPLPRVVVDSPIRSKVVVLSLILVATSRGWPFVRHQKEQPNMAGDLKTSIFFWGGRIPTWPCERFCENVHVFSEFSENLIFLVRHVTHVTPSRLQIRWLTGCPQLYGQHWLRWAPRGDAFELCPRLS